MSESPDTTPDSTPASDSTPTPDSTPVSDGTSVSASDVTPASDSTTRSGLGKSQPRSRRRLVVVGAVLAVALGILVFQGLGDATMYFRTADEAVAQRASLGEKRFRIEGNVVEGSLRVDGPHTDFAIESKGTTVQIDNKAATQGIFREGVPVVLEGRFERGSNTFSSDRIMVKHDESYKADHPERVSTTLLP